HCPPPPIVHFLSHNTAPHQLYTLSLHDALPISETLGRYIALDFGIVGSLSEFDKNYLAQNFLAFFRRDYHRVARLHIESGWVPRSEEHTSELQSRENLVCRLLLEKKK